MNKVYMLPPDEDWICDRIVKEWNEHNADISVLQPENADIIWLYSDWCWHKLHDVGLLRNKKVITTVHHIVPEKFGRDAYNDFMERDLFTTVYHVYNQQTFDYVRALTRKPIHLIKYWANQNIWKITGTKEFFRKKYGLPENGYLIGSFQRDTEGYDLKTPKIEKGPDLLADWVIDKNKQQLGKKVHVILAGWRRQYIIGRLKSNVDYSYFERPSQETILELYQTLDIYPVTSRYEGGPQSLIECGLLNVPVISRNVGIASQVLPYTSIADDLINEFPIARVPDVENWKIPYGFSEYRKLIEAL